MESEDDDLDIVGTSLEPLEVDEIPSKKPHIDETVRDEKGRQRFHGAFTGGFSAGYFNTVGSKEGWAPSSFVSSRSKKAENKNQQPEDFMDDEDFGTFGIAPRRIQATSQFDNSVSNQSRKRDFPQMSEGPIPGEPPLKDLVKPVSESVGVNLLKKMGWRPGWGIGQRTKKKKKRKILDEKVYGCSPPPGGSQSEEDDPFAASFTFAPGDVDILSYKPKDNLHGIGYSGLDRTSVLSAPINLFEPTITKALVEKGKKKLAITGQAFGIGAFEDEDEDIYSKEDMSQYDFSLDGDTSQKGQKSQPTTSKSDIFKVGKLLEGFHLATKPQPEKKSFPPPLVPTTFVPIHKVQTNEEGKQSKPSHSKFLGRHILTAEDRGTLLGERKLVPPPDSVPSSAVENSKAVIDTAKQGAEKLETSAASSSLSSHFPSFKPFANDEAKQQRYEKYLKLVQAGKKDCLSAIQPSSMTEWEKLREKEEFQRASSLYQPLSSTLGNRFVSGGKQVENDQEIANIIKEEKSDQEKAAEMKMYGHLTREKFEWRPAALLCRRFNVPNPYPHSSFVGLTKVKQEKTATFNFLTSPPVSTPQNNVQPVPSSKSNIKVEDSSDISAKPYNERQNTTASDSRELSKEAETNQGNEVPSGEKPSMDLFKMIFQDSSDDSSDSEKEEKTKEETNVKEEAKNVVKDSNSEHIVSGTEQHKRHESTNREESRQNELIVNSSVPKVTKCATGVFANLDLDALNKRSSDPVATHIKEEGVNSNQCSQGLTEGVDRVADDNSQDVEMIGSGSTEVLSAEVYGPKLPPGLITSSEAPSRKNHKKSKHRKEKHRHKHKKYKSKKSRHKSKHSHKHSKKKHSSVHNTSRTKASSNDSSSSDSGEPSNVDILQKVRQLHKSGRFSKS